MKNDDNSFFASLRHVVIITIALLLSSSCCCEVVASAAATKNDHHRSTGCDVSNNSIRIIPFLQKKDKQNTIMITSSSKNAHHAATNTNTNTLICKDDSSTTNQQLPGVTRRRSPKKKEDTTTKMKQFEIIPSSIFFKNQFCRTQRTHRLVDIRRKRVNISTRKKPSIRKNNAKITNQQQGTKITIWKPTPERIYQWFGNHKNYIRIGNNQKEYCSYYTNPIQFNHDCVGMTNPSIQVSSSSTGSGNEIGDSDGVGSPNALLTDHNNDILRTKPVVLSSSKASLSSNNKQSQLCYDEEQIDSSVVSSYGSNHRRGSSSSSSTVDKEWWPPTSCPILSTSTTTSSTIGSDNGSGNIHETISLSSSGWRIINMRCRVGVGKQCYESVRDAVLDWQFSRDQQGMMKVMNNQQQHASTTPISSSATTHAIPKPGGSSSGGAGRFGRGGVMGGRKIFRRQSSYDVLPYTTGTSTDDNVSASSSSSSSLLNNRLSKNALEIWSGPNNDRRFVTFSASNSGILKFLPIKLYAINPVMAIYDVVDQRGKGTTFTSTAYATLRGHLLCGEERVTVAFRDETQFVDIEILSHSRSTSSMKGKLIWPMIGKMQQKFFVNQINHFKEVAQEVAVEATKCQYSSK